MLPQLQFLDFFSSINQFTKDHETQINFLEDERLYVIKGFLPMKTIESILVTSNGL